MPTTTLDRLATPAAARPAASTADASVVDLPAFQPLALVARGPSSEVWKVYDKRVDQVRALKIATGSDSSADLVRTRLRHETQVLQKTNGAFLVRLLETELTGPVPYVLLEWLEGHCLDSYMTRNRRSDYQIALWIARQCLQGLQELWLAGYVHSDVQPQHVFVCQSGAVKLLGLGHAERDQVPLKELADRLPDDTHLAGTGGEMPAPPCSPCLAAALLGLGTMLYQLLTGEQPIFSAESPGSARDAAIDPRRLRQLAPDVPREFSELVHSLLACRQERRGPGLASLVHQLVGLEIQLLPETD